jgi:hypothetical protein
MATNSEQPEKIFCLFHQKMDCICINPVIDQKNLKLRLEAGISINDRLNKHALDETEKARREAESETFRGRIEGLNLS